MATASSFRRERARPIEPGVLVLGAACVAGVVATVLTAWATASSPIMVDPTDAAVWKSLIVASYVAVGVYTWLRRPDSRLGPIVAGAGFVYGATSLTGFGSPAVHALGVIALAVAIPYTAYMYLCYPGGWLESRLERGFMLALALSAALLVGLILAISPTFSLWDSLVDCGSRCPPNGLRVVSGDAGVGEVLNTALNILYTIALIGVSMLIFHKARSPAYLRRRTMMPLAVVFVVSLIGWVIALVLVIPYPETKDALRIVDGVLLLAVPVAIIVGQVRGDVFAARSLGRIALGVRGTAMTPAAVERAIGDALGDSTLTLAPWAPARDGYTDVRGAPLELPRDDLGRGVTCVTRNGLPLAALIHDPTLDTDSDIVEGLAATAMMLLENARLVEELQASRSRIVETAERERQRLERDLHDGAQNRLMAIQVKLRLAQRAEGKDLAEQLETISVDAAEAVDQLRALARGIYPSVLRDRGVADALRSFAMTAPIPISVTDEGMGRCPGTVEAAIYFCSLEAIQNTIKHAGSTARVAATLSRGADGVEFTIADDGLGMDTSSPREGMGLISMRDRIGAVGGELEVVSLPGRGTTMRGTIPDERLTSPLRQREAIA